MSLNQVNTKATAVGFATQRVGKVLGCSLAIAIPILVPQALKSAVGPGNFFGSGSSIHALCVTKSSFSRRTQQKVEHALPKSPWGAGFVGTSLPSSKQPAGVHLRVIQLQAKTA